MKSETVSWWSLLEIMRKFGEIRGDGPADIVVRDVTIGDLRERARQLQKVGHKLLPWASYLREEAAAVALGLSTFLNASALNGVPGEHVVLAFQAAVAVEKAKATWQADARLVSFRGAEHDELRRLLLRRIRISSRKTAQL